MGVFAPHNIKQILREVAGRIGRNKTLLGGAGAAGAAGYAGSDSFIDIGRKSYGIGKRSLGLCDPANESSESGRD